MRVLVAVTAAALLAAGLTGCGSGAQAGRVSVLATWTGQEGADFRALLARFTQRTGIEVDYVGNRDAGNVLAAGLKSGDPPDVAVVSDPEDLHAYAADGRAAALDGVVGRAALERDYPPQWLALMRAGTPQVRGLVVKATAKSLLWYSPPALRAAGAPVPRTWDDVTALTQSTKGSAKGSAKAPTPWCLGLESTSASGWPGTDWIEDLVLHGAGPRAYDDWASGRLAWTSPEVKAAWQRWGTVVGSLYGGPRRALLTGFGDAGRPMLQRPAGCLLDHEASFVLGSYAAAGRSPGTDFDAVPFPRIDPRWAAAQEIGADFAALFRSTPASRRLVQFLATPAGQLPSVRTGDSGPGDRGAVSVHRGLDPDAYGGNAIAASLARTLTSPATTLSFDASDEMPAAMRTAFYAAVLQFVADPTRLDAILDRLESVRRHAY
jgi:alpha-glucoside transport system substrate-binding protein